MGDLHLYRVFDLLHLTLVALGGDLLSGLGSSGSLLSLIPLLALLLLQGLSLANGESGGPLRPLGPPL